MVRAIIMSSGTGGGGGGGSLIVMCRVDANNWTFRPLMITSDLSIQFSIPDHAQTYTGAIFLCVSGIHGDCVLVLLVLLQFIYDDRSHGS